VRRFDGTRIHGLRGAQNDVSEQRRDRYARERCVPPCPAALGLGLFGLSGLFAHVVEQSLFELDSSLLVLIFRKQALRAIPRQLAQLILEERDVGAIHVNAVLSRVGASDQRYGQQRDHRHQQGDGNYPECDHLVPCSCLPTRDCSRVCCSDVSVGTDATRARRATMILRATHSPTTRSAKGPSQSASVVA
jgi:hypothetical protein